jgi:hypothetical protein
MKLKVTQDLRVLGSRPKTAKKHRQSARLAVYFCSGGAIRTHDLRVMSRALRVLGSGLRAGLSAEPDDLGLLQA